MALSPFKSYNNLLICHYFESVINVYKAISTEQLLVQE